MAVFSDLLFVRMKSASQISITVGVEIYDCPAFEWKICQGIGLKTFIMPTPLACWSLSLSTALGGITIGSDRTGDGGSGIGAVSRGC